jgi:hypothetical protein
MDMSLSLCCGKLSISEQRLSINVHCWQFFRLHALGCVPVVKAHAIEIVPNVIVILLGTIKNAYRHLGHACEMDRELRLDHTSSAAAWVGILVNTWQGIVEHLWPLVVLHRYFAILAGAVQV